MVSAAENNNVKQSKKHSDKSYQSLEQYILQLFGYKKLPVNISKQIEKFTTTYEYTYYGIEKALEYFYVLQEHPAQKNLYSIGIVPYIYDEAGDYYQKVEAASQADEGKTIDQTVVSLRIKPPDRKIPHKINIEDL